MSCHSKVKLFEPPDNPVTAQHKDMPRVSPAAAVSENDIPIGEPVGDPLTENLNSAVSSPAGVRVAVANNKITLSVPATVILVPVQSGTVPHVAGAVPPVVLCMSTSILDIIEA